MLKKDNEGQANPGEIQTKANEQRPGAELLGSDRGLKTLKLATLEEASQASPEGLNDYVRKPEWLKIQLSTGDAYRQVQQSLNKGNLHTVCEEARCPNLHECWGKHKTATFMILGDTCTRRCRFCNVKTGLPRQVDREEPARVAQSAKEMGLAHVVITMVNRDDLPDGGALILAETVERVFATCPDSTIEILSSDLMGKRSSIEILAHSRPTILSHNMETVRRLTPLVRSRSTYDRSLEFLRLCREIEADVPTKSSIMLGLGETFDEILEVMDDLRSINVDMMNIGQYLQPSRTHIPVQKYWTPEEFARLKEEGLKRGFRHVESGPLVRSSYHAGEQYETMKKRASSTTPTVSYQAPVDVLLNPEAQAQKNKIAEMQRLARQGG